MQTHYQHALIPKLNAHRPSDQQLSLPRIPDPTTNLKRIIDIKAYCKAVLELERAGSKNAHIKALREQAKPIIKAAQKAATLHGGNLNLITTALTQATAVIRAPSHVSNLSLIGSISDLPKPRKKSGLNIFVGACLTLVGAAVMAISIGAGLVSGGVLAPVSVLGIKIGATIAGVSIATATAVTGGFIAAKGLHKTCSKNHTTLSRFRSKLSSSSLLNNSRKHVKKQEKNTKLALQNELRDPLLPSDLSSDSGLPEWPLRLQTSFGEEESKRPRSFGSWEFTGTEYGMTTPPHLRHSPTAHRLYEDIDHLAHYDDEDLITRYQHGERSIEENKIAESLKKRGFEPAGLLHAPAALSATPMPAR